MADADRLARVEAHLELLRLEGEYARTWDIADHDAWAALFSEDGVFERLPTNPREKQFWFEGREALAKFCRGMNRNLQGLHLLHTPSITIDGQSAQSWIHYEFRSHRRDTGERGHVLGIYKTDYLRTHAGWRIRHRLEHSALRAEGIFTGVPRELESLGRPSD